MAKKATKKPSLAERVKSDPGLLRRALKNPGLRSKLPERYLSKPQRAKRQLNVRLKQPIVAGSTTTERDLAREAGAAMTTKYAPLELQQKTALGEEQARARDTGSFYDQYQKQLATHAQNVQNIGAQAAQTGLNTQAGVTGLANTDLTQLNQRATADAQARGASAGDISQMASNAAAVRQSLVGSFVAQQAAQNAANQNYSGTLANVVAPGQKLSAQAMAAGRVRQAGEKIATTAREKGAADVQFRSERRSEEAKNVLARQALAGEVKEKEVSAKAAAASKYGPGTPVPNSYGFTYDEWTKLSTKQKNDWRSGKNKASTTTTAANKADKALEPNKYGIPAGQWAKWSTSHRQRVMAEFDKNGGPGKTTDKDKPAGPKWVTPGQSGSAMTQLGTLKDYTTRAKKGQPFIAGHRPEKPRTMEEARTKVRGYAGDKLKHPALLDAAVDAVYSGFISAATVKALKAAGYKPSEVANTLGVKTRGQVTSGSTSYNKGNVPG